MNTQSLPEHIGGYQKLEPEVIAKPDDIAVHRGEVVCFVGHGNADGATVGALEAISQYNIYRKIPVAKQSDSHERETAALPTEAAARKRVPIATGFIDYFPRAVAAVAAVSLAGNEQHNPGKPLHWDRSKSGDEADALMRHFLERGKIDSDGQRHSSKLAWRAMALLEKELEGL